MLGVFISIKSVIASSLWIYMYISNSSLTSGGSLLLSFILHIFFHSKNSYVNTLLIFSVLQYF
jgi:hypothetical protein